MSLQKKQKGALGERIAGRFLFWRGFHIIERNWRCKSGEIDLIVRRGREYRFIEVKYRTTMEFGFPEEAVTVDKLRHIRCAMETYLLQLKTLPKHYQIDVIAILKNSQNKPKIHWVQGVS